MEGGVGGSPGRGLLRGGWGCFDCPGISKKVPLTGYWLSHVFEDWEPVVISVYPHNFSLPGGGQFSLSAVFAPFIIIHIRSSQIRIKVQVPTLSLVLPDAVYLPMLYRRSSNREWEDISRSN